MAGKILVVLCLALYLSQGLPADLIQVYELALQNDPKILEAEANRDAALEAKPQSIAHLLPTLAIVGNLNQSRFDTTSTYASAQIGLQNFWEGSVFLKLSQPLYHHEYWVQLSQADNQIAQAEAEYGAEQQDLFTRTAKAYFTVLAALDNLRFAEAEKLALQRQLEQAIKRFNVGTVPITDLNEAKAAYDLANANTIAAQRALYVTKVSLREIIGVSDIELNPLMDDMPLPPPTPAKLEEWSDLSQKNNLVIIAAENRAELTRKNIDLQFAGHLPSLDIIGSVGINDTDRPVGLVANSQVIGVQMNLPLYQGGAVNSKVRQARLQYIAAQQDVDKNRRAVEKQIQDSFYGIMFSMNQVNALKTAVESNRIAVQASEAGFRVGMRTMVDVVTSQRNYYRAQRDHAQARYDYILNSLSLKQGASILSRQDVELVNGWLAKDRQK